MKTRMALLALIVCGHAAHAHDPVRPDDGMSSTVRLGVVLGARGGNYGFGSDAGLSLDLRLAPFVVGVSGSAGIGGGTNQHLALRLGYSFELADTLSLDVLGEFGYRTAHAGGGIMRDDPGVSIGEPCVGARVSLDYAVNDVSDPVTFRIGLSVFGRASLTGPRMETYEYQQCYHTGECYDRSETVEIGGVMDFGATLNLSLDFGDW